MAMATTAEWSCPLCTLLNDYRDERCAACDQARPQLQPPPKTQHKTRTRTATPAAAATSAPWRALANAAGVFFACSSDASSAPRLQVRRRRPLPTARMPPTQPQQQPQQPLPMSTASTQIEPSPWSLPMLAMAQPPPVPLQDSRVDVADGSVMQSSASTASAPVDVMAPPNFSLLGMAMMGAPAPTPMPQANADWQAPIADVSTSSVLQDTRRAAPDDLAMAGLASSDSEEEAPRRLRTHRQSSSQVVNVASASSTWECPVCTNFNARHLTHCELCTTAREGDQDEDVEENDRPDLIDLCASPRQDTDDDDDGAQEAVSDLENPYAFTQDYEPEEQEYSDQQQGPDDDYDFEEISDAEVQELPQRMVDDSAARSRRPELREFQHFVCVEDLRSSFQSRIDYRSMFASSGRDNAYSDRLEKRRRESQKRKRSKQPTSDWRSRLGSSASPLQSRDGGDIPQRKAKAKAKAKPKGKAKAKSSKTNGRAKGKAEAPRRASTSQARASKRPRKDSTGGGVRRSSAPAFTPAINHYDASGVDLGDDISTMAWEGVGSAGYF